MKMVIPTGATLPAGEYDAVCENGWVLLKGHRIGLPIGKLGEIRMTSAPGRSRDHVIRIYDDGETSMSKKTECAISRERFLQKADPLAVTFGGLTLVAKPKELSTGSLGFSVSEKVDLTVDGVPVRFQVGINITAVGSKDLPKAA